HCDPKRAGQLVVRVDMVEVGLVVPAQGSRTGVTLLARADDALAAVGLSVGEHVAEAVRLVSGQHYRRRLADDVEDLAEVLGQPQCPGQPVLPGAGGQRGALEVAAHCPGRGDLGGQLSGATHDATPFLVLGLWSCSDSAASMYGCPG